MSQYPLVYDVKMLDAKGQEIGEGEKVHDDLLPGVERELQFMEMAKRAGEDVVDYSVSIVRPDEVKRQVKAERRQAFVADLMAPYVERFGTAAVNMLRVSAEQ